MKVELEDVYNVLVAIHNEIKKSNQEDIEVTEEIPKEKKGLEVVEEEEPETVNPKKL